MQAGFTTKAAKVTANWDSTEISTTGGISNCSATAVPDPACSG